MLKPNMHYKELKTSYLFSTIIEKTEEYASKHPNEKIYRLGVGDVTFPLCDAVIKALHSAVDDQSRKDTFHGYMPECGAPFLREAISRHYLERGIDVPYEEVFVSSGACDELADIIDLFDIKSSALVLEPAYPAYVETNILAGRKILRINSDSTNGFMPLPDEKTHADIIYICSPNNPTGVVFDCETLKKWVDYANKNGSIIIFDAAYEAFIESPDLPHSIYEIKGAKSCAIEICSLSKTAGFTGTRLGYTIVPKDIKRAGVSLNDMWVRNRLSKTNGVSYIIQKGGAAVFTKEGQEQTKKNIEIYKNNARMITDTLDRAGVWYTGGKNSPYIWMKCPENMGGWEFFDYLLNEIQVIGTPGEGFGICGKGYFRFSAFGDYLDTREATARLFDLLKKG